MRVQATLVAQFRRPSGPLGRIAGWAMARRPSNRLRNRWTVARLSLHPDDVVLEVGYGPGLALELVAGQLAGGKAFGIDHSAEMFRQATGRNARAVAAGKVVLGVGDILSPPFPLPPIDKIYSVNVVQFWPDPDRTFAGLRRLLKPGGLIATTFMPRLGEDRLGQAQTRARALETTLRASGFEQIETHWLALRSAPAFCVVARA
jgi:SAM-dependent methyltransferase